ncbi:hypothetical protein P170DRAFT_506542 [Aspergillus steynii IBT 23096]|uniref:Uncharacterized protein n=1 Tax=Aspergillus steynii IBT 23096 TaxID=1392250 RepID=A0A2I2GFF0_9EURO|nr:uncharacterized protein P170DRAFT_506542 [Aspergillus steynii IBT 23096]PLB51557.1 hypothetical protein P170DRAFT_506542 [Aspergillus steynii IBT 23096]
MLSWGDFLSVCAGAHGLHRTSISLLDVICRDFLKSFVQERFDSWILSGEYCFELISRIRCPAGPVAGVMRVFVTVGGGNESPPQHIVAVDLILQGSLGAPEDISTASEPITARSSSGQREFMVLNIKGILIAKLGAFFARTADSDFVDLEFLGRNMATQVHAVRQQLNAEHRQAFINAYSRRNQSDANRVRRMKHAFGVA